MKGEINNIKQIVLGSHTWQHLTRCVQLYHQPKNTIIRKSIFLAIRQIIQDH